MSAAEKRKHPEWMAVGYRQKVIRFLLHCYFRLFHRLQVYGLEHVPAAGPLIVVPNHQSNYDGILLGLSFERPFHPMVDAAYCRAPVIGWLLSTVGAIPVDGARDKKAYRQVLEVLSRGHVAVIFPEGRRSRNGRLGSLQSGAARAAASLGIDILPVSILGAYDAWPRHRWLPRFFRPLVLRYHPPIRCERVPREQLKAAMETISSDLKAVLGPPLDTWFSS